MAQVLLIEPDRIQADILRQSFELKGHRVMMCAGAQSAIFAADAQQPDIVIIELQLIEHSGLEFLYEFRSYPEWGLVPVLVYSLVPPAEFAGSLQILKAQLGVAEYHYKPTTSLATLLAAAERHLTKQLVV